MIKKCVDVFIGYVYKNTEENEMYVINDIFYEKIKLRKLPGWDDWKEYQYSEFKELIDKGIYKFETVHYTYFPLSVGDKWTLEKDVSEYYKKGDTVGIYDVILCEGDLVITSDKYGVDVIEIVDNEELNEIIDKVCSQYKNKEVR